MKIVCMTLIKLLLVTSIATLILHPRSLAADLPHSASSPRKLTDIKKTLGVGLPAGVFAGVAGLWHTMPESKIKHDTNYYKSTLNRYRFLAKNMVLEKRELYDQIDRLLDDGDKQLKYLETIAMEKARATRTNIDAKFKMYEDLIPGR